MIDHVYLIALSWPGDTRGDGHADGSRPQGAGDTAERRVSARGDGGQDDRG